MHPDQREVPASDVLTGEVLPAVQTGQERAMTAEIDRQIATARKYPRSVEKFIKNAETLATLNPEIAASTFYKMPRDGKMIEGPSVRFAEIILSCWGNSRAEARIVHQDAKFVTSRGTALDLETNVAVAFEVRRRITTKKGDTFSDDMILVTSNAANSISFRNAAFRIVPQAFWLPIFEKAKRVAVGDAKTLSERRTRMLEYFAKLGAPADRVFATLKVSGENDITLEHVETLLGIANAVKEGDISIDEAFPPPQAEQATEEQEAERKSALDSLKSKLAARQGKAEPAEQKKADGQPLDARAHAGDGEGAAREAGAVPPNVDATTGEELSAEENARLDAEIVAEDAAREAAAREAAASGNLLGEQPPATARKGGARK